MSFEPDDEATVLRQLREEIAKIREEQFVSTLPTNNIGTSSPVNSRSGVPIPTTGVDSTLPLVIFTTKDTGVIDLLNFDGKSPSSEFTIGEVITGQLSGATATIGDIDNLTTSSGVLTLISSSITGTFQNNENINGSVGGTNIANVDGTQFTQTGRGHINAGAGSIIASAENVSAPFEIHFIDNAEQDGQTIYLRALEGQTIRMRRSLSFDGTTGNLDLDESFDIVENAIVFFQYQVASNISDVGGWVPLITNVSSITGGGSQFQFPILYPKENLGTLNGVIDLSLNQSDGHYKQITLDGDASLTFSNLPPAVNGFKFYLLTIQDGTGGHVYTDLPDSVLFESTLLGQLQTASGAQTLWQFSTADGGTNWHAQVIQAQGSGGDNLGNHEATQDLNMKTFNIFDLDVLRYAKGIEPGADSIIGFNTYGSAVENDTKMKWSIPSSVLGNPRFYEWQVDLAPIMQLTRDSVGDVKLEMLEGSVENTSGISFFHPLGALSAITPLNVELKYDNGFGPAQGGFHGFHVAGSINAQFEIRENIIRANRDLDMITNDILEIDRARFDSFGGFDSINDKDDRLLSGGAEGMVMNIPKITPFAGGFHIYFENTAETESEKEYSFEKGLFRMFRNEISDTLGIFFSNGGSIIDLNTHIQFNGGVNSNAIDPQTLKFAVKDSGFTTIDMFELTGTEHNTTNAGGMKMFTDLNLQTQDLTNVDRIHFNSNQGIVGGNQFAIARDTGGDRLDFNVPTVKKFSYRVNNEEVAELTQGSFRMLSNSFVINPSIITDGSFIIGLTSPSSPFIPGEFRLIDNAGSLDVEVFTGGNVVNLSTGIGGTSFIGFNADDDLRMNTFNITGLDVLRFQVDGGVIGFGEYGISADPSDTSMNFSIPQDRRYLFQNNLESIAFLDHTGLQLLANTSFANPQLGAREFFLTGVHTNGTGAMSDGQFRKVGNDVFVRTGGTTVNLTTLGAGGGDNLGDHTATQPLNMQDNAIINFIGWTAGIGQAFVVQSTDATWDMGSNDFYRWRIGGNTRMVLTEFVLGMQGLRIEQLADPIASLDAVNLQTLNAGLATVDLSQWSTFPAVSPVNMQNNAFTNFIGWTAGIGQAFAVQPSGATWDLGTNDFYIWRIGGFSEMVLTSGVLGMQNKRIENVLDPIAQQDVATRAFVEAQAGGDASQWSTFPALQQVNMANNAFSNFVGFTAGIGQALTIDTQGFRFDMDTLDAFSMFFGGVQRVAFTNFGHALSGGNLNMSTNKIVNVVDPTNPQDVATRAFVLANAGGAVTLGGNNVWTGLNSFTGTAHSITSPFIFIGDQASDLINLTGFVDVPFSMDVQNLFAFNLETVNLLLSGDLDMQFLRITNLDPGFLPGDAVNRAQLDAIGGFSLLDQNNIWTGNNTWTNTASFNSSFIFIGDSQFDRVFNVADQDFSLTPRTNNDIDLGAPSSRWRDLFVDFAVIGSPGLQVTGFSSFLNDVLVTSGGTLAVSGSGGLVVSGTGGLLVTSPGSGVFTGALLPQGLFFHSGSQLGFFGAGLATRNTVFDVTATGNPGTDSLLAIGAINSLMFALEEYGLINVL